nr:retrovirus-related Pol polyprotein from transposon TNT 1-94 [Tanacetum cinerariifolium]
YLTANRPDLQFAICMYARYQARPTEKHVHAVKRIFRYLRGTVNRGLWYPKDSSVSLTAFADADHAGYQDTHRSISRSVQFMGERLISWSSKRQKSVAISNCNPVFILKAIIPTKKKLDLTTGINFLRKKAFFLSKSTLPVMCLCFEEDSLTFLESRAFLVTADVPEIYMQEFWATAKLHHNSIRFKMDSRKSVLNLEAFREMLHISLRIPSQSFAELSFEEEIMEFLRSLEHSDEIRHLTDVNVNKLYQPWRSFASVINKCLTGKSSGIDSFRNSKAYKEYYACATGEAAPKPKASARKKKVDYASSTTPPIPTQTTTVVAAPRLSAVAKDKRRTSLSNVVPVQMKELTKGREESEGDKTDESDDGSNDGNDDDDDDNDDEEEIAKNDDEDKESGKGGDEVSKSEGESDKEETRQEEEESFDPIPKTHERSKDEGSNEEDQELRLSEEARIQEEEEADKLYRDVNINHGRGLQVTQNIEDSHVTLTPVHPDGSQESSSMSSFVTSMLNPIIDAGVESIFTTASSLIVSLQSPTPIMTPSTIATITTSRDAPIPPTTIPSIILKNLPTFNSAFRFDERLRSLETTFSEYRQTNLFVDAVSAIPGIVHQYMTQQMTEAV